MISWIYLQVDKDDVEDYKTYLRYKPMFETGEFFRDDITELDPYSAIISCPICKTFHYTTLGYEDKDDDAGILINEGKFEHKACGFKGVCYTHTLSPVELLNIENVFPSIINLRENGQIAYVYKMHVHNMSSNLKKNPVLS